LQCPFVTSIWDTTTEILRADHKLSLSHYLQWHCYKQKKTARVAGPLGGSAEFLTVS